MKEKSPAFQFYVRRWLSDDKVMLMDYDAKGMHMDLMCISWQQSQPGTLPNEEQVIRRWLKNPSEKVWQRVWPQLRAAWKITRKNPFKLYSHGLLRELKKQRDFSRRQSDNVRKRWESRRQNGDTTVYTTVLPRNHSGITRASNALHLQSSTAVDVKGSREKESARAHEPNGNGRPYPIPNPKSDPAGAVVMAYKTFHKKIEHDDAAWDAEFGEEALINADKIVQACGGFTEANKCLEHYAAAWEKKGFEAWTLAGVAKHAAAWAAKRKGKDHGRMVGKRFLSAVDSQTKNGESVESERARAADETERASAGVEDPEPSRDSRRDAESARSSEDAPALRAVSPGHSGPAKAV